MTSEIIVFASRYLTHFPVVNLTDQPEFVANRQPKVVYAWPGQPIPVSITCAVDSVPPPVIRWRHKQQRILNADAVVTGGRSWWRLVYHVYAVNNFTSVLQVRY
jgi:hypothetical protein